MGVVDALPEISNEAEFKSIWKALSALRAGDVSARLPTDWPEPAARVAGEFNELAGQLFRMSHDVRALDRDTAAGASHGRRLPQEVLSGVWLEWGGAINGFAERAERSDAHVRAVLAALNSLKKGHAGAALPDDWTGLFGKVSDTFNQVVEQNVRMAEELARLSRVVGKEGKLKERASVQNASGFWGHSVESINSLIGDLVHPTSEVARVIGAVAQGDLTKSMALEADDRALEGEFLRTAKIINKMVEQLGTFAAEVTRVAREVGTEGKLGGQADVQGVAGTWKDLTDSVNSMGSNLTAQVRNIAEVTTAVAAGDLSKKITVDVKGEILDLKNTINTMVDQLRSFASEVTRVAREVGTDG